MIRWIWHCILVVLLCIFRNISTDITGPVANLSCITYNWIEYVICRWNFLKGINVIKVEVLWRPVVLNSVWYHCPEPTKTSCKWNIEDGRLAIDIERKYTILIRINQDQLQQSVFHVRWNETVEPAPISNLQVINIGISCVTLKWGHSDYIHNKTYKISYKPFNSFKEKVETVYSDHDSVQHSICNLAIYTKYVVTVSCKTINKGIWSHPVSTTFSTNKSRPLPPYIYEGGYVWREATPTNVKLTLFWKVLTKSEWNADSIRYDVQLNRRGRRLSKSTGQFSLTFDVERNSTHKLLIWTRNEIGNSRQLSMQVPPYKELDLINEVFAVKNQTHWIQLSWKNPQNKNISFYSIFWCEHAFSDICSKSPSAINVSSSISQPIAVELQNITSSYLYGVSYTTTEYISSGFMWSECYVDLTSKEFPYKLDISLHSIHEMISVKWQLSKCRFLLKTLKIEMFQVQICEESICKGYRELNVSGTENMTFIPKTNENVCVQVWIYWGENFGTPSKVECIEVETKSDRYLKIVFGVASIFIIVAFVGFCLVVRKIAETIKKAKRPFVIELPVVQNNTLPANFSVPLLESG